MKNNPRKNDPSMIYGIRPAIEAIKAGKEIERIMLQHKLFGEGFHELFALIRELNIPFQYVPIERLNKITRKNHQGAITFLSEITFHTLEQLLPTLFEEGKTPTLLILDQITDIRNFGAITRTAECAGADAIIIPDRGAASVNADAVKTSAGALYKLPVVRSSNLKETIRYIKESGLLVIAATEKATLTYTDADLTLPTAFIMGSEGTGISPEYLKLCDLKIRIPVFGEIPSLNVGIAAGILLYERIRQRNLNKIS